MRKIVLTGTEAREELAKGAEFLAKAVGSTLGPHGLNFRMQKGKKVSNDGVKIASEIALSNEVQNEGLDSLREAAIKTNDQVGDGTTTAIVLSWAIYQAAANQLSKKGTISTKTPSEIVQQIERERKEVDEKLLAMAMPIETEEALCNSARVSVEDEALGNLIGKAQWAMGKDGYLLAETTMDSFSSMEQVRGVRIDNGFGTSQVVNNQERRTCEVEQTKVLLTTYSIKDFNDWQKIMKVAEQVAKMGSHKLVVIARAWTDETINYCLRNLTNPGGMQIYPFNAPYVDMQERMKDLAAVVGAKFFDSETSSLDDLQASDIGYADRIVGRIYDAVITGGSDDRTKERVEARLKELEDKLNGGEVSEFEKKMLLERIAQLKNGFALIKVGSPSDIERKRLYDKCEDAVNAVRVAFQEGTAPGAGLAFKLIADSLPDEYLLKRPLNAIYEQIMSTCPPGFVIEDWVRDPVKVLRVALQNACAAASSFATAAGVIVTKLPPELDEVLGKKGSPNE